MAGPEPVRSWSRPFPLTVDGCAELGKVAAIGVDALLSVDVLVAWTGAGVVDVDVGCLLDDSGARFGSSEDGVDIQDPIVRNVYVMSSVCERERRDIVEWAMDGYEVLDVPTVEVECEMRYGISICGCTIHRNASLLITMMRGDPPLDRSCSCKTTRQKAKDGRSTLQTVDCQQTTSDLPVL